MTNLILSILLTNQLVCVSFTAQPFTDYRLQRRASPSTNTNWLGADFYDWQPFSQPVVLCDAFWAADAWYRVVGMEVGR